MSTHICTYCKNLHGCSYGTAQFNVRVHHRAIYVFMHVVVHKYVYVYKFLSACRQIAMKFMYINVHMHVSSRWPRVSVHNKVTSIDVLATYHLKTRPYVSTFCM